MMILFVVLAGTCSLSLLVSASIYPTQPVQATVWWADRPTLVTWIDDDAVPRLSEMGAVDITLWSDTERYLLQLASGVDPTTKACQVTVPGSALALGRGSTYTLKFTTGKPAGTVIYSADFAIEPANATTDAGRNGQGGNVALATQSGTSAGFGSQSRSGVGSGLTRTSAGFTFSFEPSPTPTTGSSSGGPPRSGTTSGQGERPTAGLAPSNAGRRTVDVEKLKFRFVFVIWPVLMGITMAW